MSGDLKNDRKILPEILEKVFHHTGHESLRIFRLVCKDWNNESCRILRKISIIHISECDENRVKSAFEVLQCNAALKLPLPFCRCHLEVESVRCSALKAILEHESLCISGIRLKGPLEKEYEPYVQILTKLAGREQLESISFSLNCGTSPCSSITTDCDFQFSKLKTVELIGKYEERIVERNGIVSLPQVQLVIGVINGAADLKSFASSIWDDTVLIHVLKNVRLDTIHRLSLSNVTPNVFIELKSMKIWSLKILELEVAADAIDEEFVGSEVARDVVQSFAETLEELCITWNFNCVSRKFPFCPKLKKLNIKYWSGGLGSFDSLKLPSLKSLQVFDCIHELCTQRLNPHDGVEAFGFECLKGTGVRYGLYSEEDFTQVLMNVNRQFPHLTCLDLSLALTAKALQRVILHFPLLKQLVLESDNEYVESIFTGIPEEPGSSLESSEAEAVDFAVPSLLDLKFLQRLVLARKYDYHFPFDVAVTDRVIKLGLSRMPRLTHLQFDWEDGINPEVFLKNMSHLSRIVINYAGDMNGLSQLQKLKEIMPQVSLRIHHPSVILKVANRLQRSSTRRPSRRHRQLGIF